MLTGPRGFENTKTYQMASVQWQETIGWGRTVRHDANQTWPGRFALVLSRLRLQSLKWQQTSYSTSLYPIRKAQLLVRKSRTWTSTDHIGNRRTQQTIWPNLMLPDLQIPNPLCTNCPCSVVPSLLLLNTLPFSKTKNYQRGPTDP